MSKVIDALITIVIALAIVTLVSIHIGKPLVNTDYGNDQKVKSILLMDK
ncbi:TPA: hypothetical protein ACNFR3_002639 [Escherichia coli]